MRQDRAMKDVRQCIIPEMRQGQGLLGGETRGSAGNWRQQCRMQIEDKTR